MCVEVIACYISVVFLDTVYNMISTMQQTQNSTEFSTIHIYLYRYVMFKNTTHLTFITSSTDEDRFSKYFHQQIPFIARTDKQIHSQRRS